MVDPYKLSQIQHVSNFEEVVMGQDCTNALNFYTFFTIVLFLKCINSPKFEFVKMQNCLYVMPLICIVLVTDNNQRK